MSWQHLMLLLDFEFLPLDLMRSKTINLCQIQWLIDLKKKKNNGESNGPNWDLVLQLKWIIPPLMCGIPIGAFFCVCV